jgi:hypothetical protein
VPTEHGLGPNNLGHFLQCLPAKTPTTLGEVDSLRIGELQSPLDLIFENPVLRRQVFVLEE